MTILAGDIGGTNARLALYDSEGDDLKQIRAEVFPSGGFDSLSDVLDAFFTDAPLEVEAACLGLPGPVGPGDEVRLTNLPWRVRRAEVGRVLGIDRVRLINDVEATAAAIPSLGAEQLQCLQAGSPNPEGHRAVVAVGTGLGVGGLTASGRPFATEAGHASFSPRSDFDLHLLQALRQDFGHVSWERVASGPAIPAIYSGVSGVEDSGLAPADVVARSATDPDCRRTLEIFLGYLGSVAGNIALTLMASGGLYFGGGVAPRVIHTANAEIVLEAFRDKGRLRPLLERIPVLLIHEPEAALIGAARCARAIVP